MWGGLEFFVSIEALVSLAIPPSLSHDGAPSTTPGSSVEVSTVKRAGNPTVRRLHFTQERRLTPVFSYPNATLFLQVLFSTGNKVHLMTPWDKEDTTTILKSFAWVRFLADARRVSVAPGSSQFSFSSLSVDPADYTRTVLVVDDASRWSSATALQLIEVRHTRERQDKAASMELLYALSRCILFSEWYLRYPSSSIASCAALSSTTVFAFCRFFIDSPATEADLMQLICFHGGRIVHTATEATHILVLPPPPAEHDASSSTSSTSSDDSSGSEGDGTDYLVDSTDTETSEEEGESGISSPYQRSGERSAEKSDVRPFAATPQRALAESGLAAPVATTQSSSVASPATNSASQPAMVTVSWVHRCVRALRLVPLDDALGPTATSTGVEEEQGLEGRSEGVSKAEVARTTGTLLCALLPPADARPLLWTTLHAIASQHGYDTAALVQHAGKASPLKTATAASVLEALTSHAYSDVVEVRLQPLSGAGRSTDASTSSSRPRGVPVTLRTLDSLKLSTAASELSRIALYRCERRRDKEAVFSHLQLIASQFLYSFQYVLRQQSQALHRDAGTQTSGVRRAFTGTMTDAQQQQQQPTSLLLPADEEEPAGAKETAAAVTSDAQHQRVKQPSSLATATAINAAEAITSDVVGAVDEEEWRHHLRNAEGKPLMSHVHTKQVGEEETKWRVTDGGGSSRSATAAELSTKVVQTPRTQVIECTEKTMPRAMVTEEDFMADPPCAPEILAEVFRGEPPPFRPPLAPSLFKPPSSWLPPPPMAKATDEGVGRADASLTEFTACFIPTSVLTADQQVDFYAFLCSLPLFDSAELGNSVVRVADGVRCQFANHKGAKDFLRIEFIEFLSLRLSIFPALEDSLDVEDLQNTIMSFPLLPPSTAPEVTQEEARSLWTAPAPPKATAFASQASARARAAYSMDGHPHPRGSEPGPPSAHPRPPEKSESDLACVFRGGARIPQRGNRAGSRRKRNRDDDRAKELPPPADDCRYRDGYGGVRQRRSGSRHVEASSSSHRRHHGDDRSDRHGLLRDDSDHGSRNNGHHRSRIRHGRR
ncbi:hypothetical protein CUR178_05125 [Leishmania enriettii]|uniref:BRCT domain-containing protein n=1 Tax=Leishmania enriettii TaxID=5663 RepID=A0A836H0X1_LEIEN|nr:hypothetical protein CUR178_05125 [Leishmania enriettii]